MVILNLIGVNGVDEIIVLEGFLDFSKQFSSVLLKALHESLQKAPPKAPPKKAQKFPKKNKNQVTPKFKKNIQFSLNIPNRRPLKKSQYYLQSLFSQKKEKRDKKKKSYLFEKFVSLKYIFIPQFLFKSFLSFSLMILLLFHLIVLSQRIYD